MVNYCMMLLEYIFNPGANSVQDFRTISVCLIFFTILWLNEFRLLEEEQHFLIERC